MRWLLFALIVLHGLIHFMGFAKAFGLAELPQLSQPISRPMGSLWLAAGASMLATAALLIAAPRVWWMLGLASAVLSQIVIVSSWTDARFGTLVNVVVHVAALYGLASQGPLSLRTEYRREVGARLARLTPQSPLSEADVAHLPEPVQRYLRVSGAVGQPRVQHVRAEWRGRIRAGPDEPWMSFEAHQDNFPGEPARFFFMDARRSGLPVDVYHAFAGGGATMRVRLLSLWQMVDARGPELTRAETVTLLNDLVVLAPGALLDPGIRWEAVDARSARATYTTGGLSVGALLLFDERGELVDFVSDDRLAQSSDGLAYTPQRWSTPLSDYRAFGARRAAGRGEGRWHPPEGEYAYIEMELVGLWVNGEGR